MKFLGLLFSVFIAALSGCDSGFSTDPRVPAQAEKATVDGRANSSHELEEQIKTAIRQWWGATHAGVYGNSVIAAADALTCSWRNFGIEDLSAEPRASYNNSANYRYQNATLLPWSLCYRALRNVNEALETIRLNPDTLGVDTPRAKAFTRLVQGLAYGHLALYFDKAIFLDEKGELPRQIFQFSHYQVVMDSAVKYLGSSISISEANEFIVPSNWINGLSLTNTELARIAHSYTARFLAQIGRTPDERAAADWGRIAFHVSQGIVEDLTPIGDGADDWWHAMQWYHNDSGGQWARADYKLIGPSDKSGAYQDWLALPLEERDEFEIDTDDKRIWDGTRNADGQQNPGLYILYTDPTPFPPERGKYHFSRYAYYRYEDYHKNNGNGPSPIFLVKELDFLRAEAALRLGDYATATDIINSTRVPNGGYPPAAADFPGNPEDPRSPLEGSSLWAMLKYEKHIEILMTGPGVEFFDNRGWGDLVSGTPLHFPVPGTYIRELLLASYTFGGGGEGSAK
mgnify:CR=1 FL=1